MLLCVVHLSVVFKAKKLNASTDKPPEYPNRPGKKSVKKFRWQHDWRIRIKLFHMGFFTRGPNVRSLCRTSSIISVIGEKPTVSPHTCTI